MTPSDLALSRGTRVKQVVAAPERVDIHRFRQVDPSYQAQLIKLTKGALHHLRGETAPWFPR